MLSAEDMKKLQERLEASLDKSYRQSYTDQGKKLKEALSEYNRMKPDNKTPEQKQIDHLFNKKEVTAAIEFLIKTNNKSQLRRIRKAVKDKNIEDLKKALEYAIAIKQIRTIVIAGKITLIFMLAVLAIICVLIFNEPSPDKGPVDLQTNEQPKDLLK